MAATELHYLFNPRSIAVVGASDRPASIGARTLENLLEHSRFEGEVYLVSASRSELGGRPCYPNVSALPATPDVVIVVVPATAAMDVLEECAARGVRFAVVLTSGFGETGAEGQAMEAQMREIVARSGMRIYGPNCPGVCNINARLGITFSPSFPHDLIPGPIGIATQGGALGRNFMQAMERGIGVAMWASSGNEVDLQVSDFIAYMADAPDIRVIVALIEGVRDGRRFVDAVQRAARAGKPVVALKVGRSEFGQKAAASHTASITGSAEVNAAVLRQLGVIEVDDIDELVDTAWLLSRATPTGLRDLAVYATSGGAAALTADIIGQNGMGLTAFTAETTQTLTDVLPSFAATGNPVDTTATVVANPALVESTLLAVARDPGAALVVVPITIDYGDVTCRIAESVINTQKNSPVPILPVWMSDRMGPAFGMYAKAGLVPAKSLGKAIKAIRRWADYGAWRQLNHPLQWQPWPSLGKPVSTEEGLLSVSEADAKAALAAAGIRVPRSILAKTRTQAVEAAQTLGYPLVAKIASTDILHKSDVGGVVVGLADAESVGQAWDSILASVHKKKPDAAIDGMLIEQMLPPGGVETLVGVSRDPVFGHVLTFGLGGVYVEVFKDVSRRLLPLQREEAEAMVREIRSFPLLDGARGRPRADLSALIDLLIKVSDFVGRHADDIDEMDLNPVWVGPAGQGAVALDAVIVGRTGASGFGEPRS
ncbi:acetate--CoA ligase family protein [Bordetella genomosp. 4]|uniref:acetate--CoA ligase family protein n=1 Tax=Bordetella genomosp. 4 TaxID=463044 RepID=UPI000B9ECF26|nr:acetate--CoA ligase family protein [Bordetella genomosp. 4]OZI44340.1 acyl-CoA synthetase [Bordetella genomosp. 4]